MAYPNAYCVKCGTHTNTEQKHTVILQNSSRALKGVCPKCESKVYKILPKGMAYKTTVDADYKGSKKKSLTVNDFPKAYCVKCQNFTPTKNAKGVVLQNGSRAVKGNCCNCGSESYRILGKERLRSIHPGEKRISSAPQKVSKKSTIETRKSHKDMTWALWLGFGLVTGAVAAVLFLV